MLKNNPKAIVIHCTDVSYTKIPDQFRSVNAYHRDEREFPESSLGIYVGYHRLITGGKNYKCREDSEVGAHCNEVANGVSMNVQSLGICFGGDGDIEYPAPAEYQLMRDQVHQWQTIYGIPDSQVFFHNHFATWKTCAGQLLGDEWLAKFLYREPIPWKAGEQYDNQEGIEVAAAKKTALLLAAYTQLVGLLTELYQKLLQSKR